MRLIQNFKLPIIKMHYPSENLKWVLYNCAAKLRKISKSYYFWWTSVLHNNTYYLLLEAANNMFDHKYKVYSHIILCSQFYRKIIGKNLKIYRNWLIVHSRKMLLFAIMTLWLLHKYNNFSREKHSVVPISNLLYTSLIFSHKIFAENVL